MLVVGVPEICGGEFAMATITVMEKAARLSEDSPSETLITMFELVPASASPGVPDRRPVDESKLAHVGRLEMENVSVSLSGSDAVGVNKYATPAFTLLGGEPEIRGGEFVADALTVIENAPRLAEDVPSDTLITIFPSVPASPIVGMPDNFPVDESKLAQDG